MLLSRPQAIDRITTIDKIHNLNSCVYISPPTCALRPIILNNARPSRITAAAGTRLAGTSKICTVIIYTYSTEFTTYVAVILKAISLDQACAHCPIFPTAAARKRLGRVSVPVWPIILSNRLGILGLVRYYHTNYLIPRKLIHGRYISKPQMGFCNISPQTMGRFSRVTHPFATHKHRVYAFNLHVLGVSLALILSQDQTHVI